MDIAGKGWRKQMLFDTATSAEPILHNMDLLRLMPRDIDLIVLSHDHFDHTGGLAGIMEAIDKENVPVVAHPEILKTSVMVKPYSDWNTTSRHGRHNNDATKPLALVAGLHYEWKT